MTRISILCVLLSLFVGCGSSSDPAPAASASPTTTNSFTGTYTGTETGTQDGINFSQAVFLILTQSDSSVTGTFGTGSTQAGTVSGTVSGSSISPLTITEQAVGGCFGSIPASVTLSDTTLTGSISVAASGNCGALSATFSLNKQ